MSLHNWQQYRNFSFNLSPSNLTSELHRPLYTAYRSDEGSIIIAKKNLITEEIQTNQVNPNQLVAIKAKSFPKPVILISYWIIIWWNKKSIK